MKKEKFSERLLDGILELILTLVVFGVGVGCVKLFGIGKFFDTADFDLMCLFGIGILTIVILAVCLIRKFVRRKHIETNEDFIEKNND